MLLSGSPLNPAAVASTLSPFLSVVSSTPSNSAVLASSPSTLTVTFDRPIDDFSIGIDDFELMHVASDGSTSPLLSGEAQLDESLDPDRDQIDLALSNPLVQGSYELVLSPDNELAGVDGSSVATPSSGLVVDDFTFSPLSGSLATATDLQTLGSQVTSVPGNLDLSSNPGAVDYYKFELGQGHHWLVGLEILAHSEGGSLDSSISLFDSQGKLIRTANEGLSSDPSDPYLFQGLDPGTYYVGIAAKKNLPDASGTYDQSSTAIAGNPGGPYQLDLVADTADQPTHLLGLRLDHADPLSTNPTGLTLQFSGALDIASLERSRQSGLELVDQSGKTWPVTPTKYDPATGQLSLAFDQPLATGTYSLELTGSSSLTDLAGRAPIASGLAAGTLGSFTVTSSSLVAGDLGPILPGQTLSGISSTVDLTPSKPVTEQFVVVVPGIYSVEGVDPSSGIGLSFLDGSGNALKAASVNPSNGVTLLDLKPGVYQVVLTTDSQFAAVTLKIRQRAGQFDSLLESGVSQLPALSLRLVTPQPGFGEESNTSTTPASPVTLDSPSPAPAPSSSGDPSSLATHLSDAAESRSGDGSPTVAIGLTTSASLSVSAQLAASGPAGRPSSQGSQISVVGISGSSGLAAIASNSTSIQAGLFLEPIDGEGELDPAVPPVDLELKAESGVTPRMGVTLESGLLARAPGSRREDDRTLADADWISGLVGDALAWVEGTSVGVAGGETSPADSGQVPTAQPTRIEEGRLESASMASPIGFGVLLGLFAYGKRLRASRGKPALSKPGTNAGSGLHLAGPHSRSRVRVH